MLHADAAHGSHRQGANERIWIRCVLDKGVDCHDRQVGLALGVVDEVEVHKLFQLDVGRLERTRRWRGGIQDGDREIPSSS